MRSKINLFANNPQMLFLWLVGLTALSIAGKLSLGTPFAVIPSLIMVALAVLTFVSPWLGLLAVFPLSTAIYPTPQYIGFREIAFASICAALVVSNLLVIHRDATLEKRLRNLAPIIVCASLFLMLNFYVARGNAVPLADWLRGLIPFLFITLYFPVSILLQENSGRLKWMIGSLLVMAVVINSQVLVVFFVEELYKPVYYQMVDGAVIITDPSAFAGDIGDLLVGYSRVTLKVAQSTDALLPLTFSVAFVICVLASTKIVRRVAFIVLCISLAAILVTYTRSMLLCALFTVCLFGLFLLFTKSRFFWASILDGLGGHCIFDSRYISDQYRCCMVQSKPGTFPYS